MAATGTSIEEVSVSAEGVPEMPVEGGTGVATEAAITQESKAANSDKPGHLLHCLRNLVTLYAPNVINIAQKSSVCGMICH